MYLLTTIFLSFPASVVGYLCEAIREGFSVGVYAHKRAVDKDMREFNERTKK